jgi:anti-anti-sigma factor
MAGEDTTALVHLRGELDISKREQVSAALPSPPYPDRIIINCSAVTYADSTVIKLFMELRRLFVEAGHDPHKIVIIASPQVRRVFEMAGLDKALTIVAPT